MNTYLKKIYIFICNTYVFCIKICFLRWNMYLIHHGIINTKNTISFSVSKISFINLMTPIDSTNKENTMRRDI